MPVEPILRVGDAIRRERSTQREVRNPILALPAARKIVAEDAPWRGDLRQLLIELRDDCRERAAKAWATHKGPMALYWKTCGVICNHIARVLR